MLVVRILLFCIFYCILRALLPLSVEDEHSVVLRSVDSEEVINYGVLKYISGKWVWNGEDGLDIDTSKVYCVGIEGDAELSCFNYKKIKLNDEIVVSTGEDGSIDQLTVLSRGEGKKLSQLHITSPSKGPKGPVNNKVVERTKEGTTVTVSTEKEKSFIQKYWMYIVPPLILFMVMTDGGGRLSS